MAKRKKKTKHNHGAAVSGYKSEVTMKGTIGLIKDVVLLKVKDDYWRYRLDPEGRRYFPHPEGWREHGKKNRFHSDGFIYHPKSGRGVILEQKHSDKHGTTEEKVFYDLAKIERGVYDTGHPLYYVFTGNVAHEVGVYHNFKSEVERRELQDKVKIIWGHSNLAKEIKKEFNIEN